MKAQIILFLLIVLSPKAFSQSSAERVALSETYSSNGKFELRSVSYDDDFPNLIGQSVVTYTQEYHATGGRKKFYELNRSFDLWEGYPYFVAISNDGRKIIYIKDAAYFKGEEHKEVTYYVDGKLQKSYTAEEFTSCDRMQEKCGMFYNNNQQVYTGTNKEFKSGVSDEEKFLNKNFVFNKNDTIYVVDARRKVTRYDLNSGSFIGIQVDFSAVYPQVKDLLVVKSNISYYKYPFKRITDIENVTSGEKLSLGISKISKLKFVGIDDADFYKYQLYKISLTGYLYRNGKFEIDKFEADQIFDKDKIEQYLTTTVFNTEFIPQEVDRIYLKNFFGGYRAFNDKQAKRETEKQKQLKVELAQKRLTLEKIDDVYIPKDLYESMIELDKALNFESKKQLMETKDAWLFNSHLGGLGMWIRNNWGINGGSRLSKYFHDRKIGLKMSGNDEISGIIIEEYIKWLKGDKTSWEAWEKAHPKK